MTSFGILLARQRFTHFLEIWAFEQRAILLEHDIHQLKQRHAKELQDICYKVFIIQEANDAFLYDAVCVLDIYLWVLPLYHI